MLLLTLITASLLMVPSPAYGQHTEAELVDGFMKSASAVFDRAKAKPSDGTINLLRDWLKEGASRLISDRRTSGKDIAASGELVKRFAAEIVKHGVRKPDGTVQLSEDSFLAAQRATCPLYPFC